MSEPRSTELSRELEERTRHYYERVDAGDVEGVLAWFAHDAVYERPGYAPMRGRAALAAFYGGERVIADGAHLIDELVVDGDEDRVAVRGRFEGTLKDGSSVSLGFADFIVYGRDVGAAAGADTGSATVSDAPYRAVERRTFFDRPAV
ncbi:nuclear transport factor 2 family protein [Ornithinimicrobium sp. Y1847]|uniref:nuclear transport factor 2 family protein n=1 Tax=unclassified Ornithinimicrobium TaxID=2615080 RepID=UPI003B682BC8